MHDSLLQIPNSLFYDGKIKSAYKVDSQSVFMGKGGSAPMLFINCDDKEKKFSNSYFNMGEVKLVADLL